MPGTKAHPLFSDFRRRNATARQTGATNPKSKAGVGIGQEIGDRKDPFSRCYEAVGACPTLWDGEAVDAANFQPPAGNSEYFRVLRSNCRKEFRLPDFGDPRKLREQNGLRLPQFFAYALTIAFESGGADRLDGHRLRAPMSCTVFGG